MGQEEIVKALRNGNWLLSREISEKLNVSLGSVQSSLRRMIIHGEVECSNAKEVIRNQKRLKSRHFIYAYRLKKF